MLQLLESIQKSKNGYIRLDEVSAMTQLSNADVIRAIINVDATLACDLMQI